MAIAYSVLHWMGPGTNGKLVKSKQSLSFSEQYYTRVNSVLTDDRYAMVIEETNNGRDW